MALEWHFGRIQWQLFAEIHSRAIFQSLRPYLMENRTGNSNRHKRNSIGQIKVATPGQIREDQHKDFDQDLTCKNFRRFRRNNIFCLNVSEIQLKCQGVAD